ncbi:MAG: hypothetical protein HY906_17450, partial [Deltaproteobacteria bacterium]|nr:hypothetical protein [Deltaproteobacteria bacterium]
RRWCGGGARGARELLARRTRARGRGLRQRAPQRPWPAAPRVVLTGQVRSRGTRAPIPLARVVTGDGVEANPGRHWVHVAAAGFVNGAFKETLDATKSLDVVYGLTPLRANPFETIVRGERERTELSRVELRGAAASP